MSFQKKSKWLFIILIVFLIGGFAGYKYMYKPHKTTEEISASYTGKSDSFLSKIQKDASIWNNKTVELSGTITSVVDKGFIMDNTIYCQLREDVNSSSLKTTQPITIKGLVIGYDDLLNELKLNQCIIK